jgi:hypothetical protein
MGIRALKEFITANGGSSAGLVEKSELVAAARIIAATSAAGAATASSSAAAINAASAAALARPRPAASPRAHSGGGNGDRHGGASVKVRVQVEPMKPMMKAPGTKRLKLNFDKALSSFATNFNLRLYHKVEQDANDDFAWKTPWPELGEDDGRGVANNKKRKVPESLESLGAAAAGVGSGVGIGIGRGACNQGITLV